MRSITKENNHRKIVLIILAILTIACIAAVYLYLETRSAPTNDSQTKPVNSIDYSKPTNEQIGVTRDTNTKTDPQENPSSPNNNHQITITSTNQSDDLLKVRVLITPQTDSGTCSLELNKVNEATIAMTAPIQALPSSSTCQGFDVSTKDLAKGTWKLKVTTEINAESSSVNKDVSIQ